jgi:alpha-L-fucosidase
MTRPARILIAVTATLASLSVAAHAADAPSAKLNLPVAPGPFKPTMESLATYQIPDWFRDAKFGIWSHWGPQAVPGVGGWYARDMYKEGTGIYKFHVEHYGHPSVFGYKDIIPLWKAEKWDPQRLMALYKKAGAKYFVSMGTHHDNFFLWNSKLHRWNSVNMGPKRDVVGEWQKAALKEGLRFGVSEHLAASFTWLQTSHGADREGPKAGVPYDGADPKNQDFYHFAAGPGDSFDDTNKVWYSSNPRWQQQWYDEIKELVDNYHPDLLYSDGGMPFGATSLVGTNPNKEYVSPNDIGPSQVANLYNLSAARHNGKSEAVYTCKFDPANGRWVEDLERGIMEKIAPHPWQTDTSIGDWFYNRNWSYQPVSRVIHTLVDNVSKNGNLLLNVVQRPDGSLDPEVERMLGELAEWTALNGEAIYGSRPWLVYGESQIKVKAGNYDEVYKFNAREIRFTTKGATLYAFALGWPEDGKILIRSLGKPAGSDVNTLSNVSLLGYDGKLDWKQPPDGLTVNLPAIAGAKITVALKITGSNLKNILLDLSGTPPVTADAHDKLTLLPEDAEHSGGGIRSRVLDNRQELAYWSNGNDSALWRVVFAAPGKYRLHTSAASPEASEFVVRIGDRELAGHAPKTAGWEQYGEIDLGTVEIKAAGKMDVRVSAKDVANWKPINLRAITLSPE